MANERNDMTSRASASEIEGVMHGIRNCKGVTFLGEYSTREYLETWIVEFLCTYAGVETLTPNQFEDSIAIIRDLAPADVTLEGFASACKRKPALAELAAALKARIAVPSPLLSDSRDDLEVDFTCVVDTQFNTGNGVLSFDASTPDEIIVFAIRKALAGGKPFTVIPA